MMLRTMWRRWSDAEIAK